jgi:hypothetical protein
MLSDKNIFYGDFGVVANLIKLSIAIIIIALPLSAFALPFTETIHNDWFFLGDFHTYDYASLVDLDHSWIGTSSRLSSSLSWSHTLPDGFQVPPYEITRARLWIDACYVDTDNNLVEIGGMMDWDALNHCWLDNTTFDMSNVNQDGFWNDGQIDVSVFAGECSFRLDRAILMMDYCPSSSGGGTPVPATIPEPATFVLFGIGLAGAAISRFRKN